MLGFLIGPVERNQSGVPDWFRLRLASDAPNWFRCRNGFACASNSVSLAPQRNHSDASDLRRKRNQSDASDWFRLRLASDASNWFRCRIGFACASNSVSFAPQRNHSAASDLRRKRNQSDASDWFRLRLRVVARVGFRSSVFGLWASGLIPSSGKSGWSSGA